MAVVATEEAFALTAVAVASADVMGDVVVAVVVPVPAVVRLSVTGTLRA
jgi:hypothetical protein